MISLQTRHTAQLNQEVLQEARALLDLAFDGDFADDDWQHALGGLHVLARREGKLVGHAAVVQRQLLHQGRSLRAGYLEATAVDPAQQRRGIGVSMMAEVEQIIRAAYELGALGASDAGLQLYQKRGWLPWRGRAMAFTPSGVIYTQEEDCLFVFETSTTLDREADITCDYREGDLW
jgi:aminoglycoside 2'-N-acetyltransferase I